mmetsp:Transcript_4738/g.9439  ORF Transcript_4738/g.9439 Transcript_4738/m.9439 type:complete len:83 (-) Transcript_4738:165-413(-)
MCLMFSFPVDVRFLTLTQAITWTGTFMVFTTFGLVGVIFSYYCIPDLAGAKLGGVNAENTLQQPGSLNHSAPDTDFMDANKE